MDDRRRIDEAQTVATWREDWQELLVDTAISHLDKLRRVVMLEEWIRNASDDPLLARTCREWQAERERLLAEFDLEQVVDI
jgi:hypothetical protein